MYLIGTQMDYVSNDLMQEFVFYVCNFLTWHLNILEPEHKELLWMW
jgi:hypothetical protein